MIEPSAFLVFLAGALALNFTPGPDMAFTLATSAKGGVRAGLAASLGVGVGALLWALFAALGLAAIVAASSQAMVIIRILGGLYLLYLAIQTWRARDEIAVSNGAGAAGDAFRSGVVTNLLNPKVGLFFLAFLPAFTDPAAGAIWLQSLVLGGVFATTGTLVLMGVALAAGAAQARLAQSANFRRTLNAVSAGIFGALGARLLVIQSS